MSFISSIKLSSRLYRRCTSLSCRTIHTSLFAYKNDKDDGKSATIDKLIGDMGGDSTNKKTLDSLVKTLKDQSNHEKMTKMKRELNRFEEISKKKGEEFWFPEPIQESTSMSDLRLKDTEDIDKIESQIDLQQEQKPDQDISSAATEKKPLEIEKLKQQINNEGDNRSVSKLMSALIDNIDNDAENAEQSFKKLLSTFNKTEVSQQSSPSPGRWQKNFRKGKYTGTFFHEPTDLFGTYKETGGSVEESGFTSLHEIQWKENLQNLLPESIPENMFEVKMLDIDREWRFPINNEQDMGIEDVTSFEEHVFLDHYLDEFPDEGPVRKFMELVVTGLQQNPHLSVEEKTNRIFWFKDYFEKFPEEELTMISMED